jgi:hypothetical protein
VGPGTDATSRSQLDGAEASESGSSPSLVDATGSRLERAGRLASAVLLLLLAFSAAVLVGGLVSSAAYGGKFPDLRSAFRGIMPTPKAAPASCHSELSR